MTSRYGGLSCAGNSVIQLLARDGRQELRIDLEDWEGNKTYALYDKFELMGKRTKYILHSVGNYSGTAGRYGTET